MRQYGLQLYSVKSHMEADMAATLREVAAMGYTMVEPAGFFGKTAEEFRALCDQNGLTVCGSHTGMGGLVDGACQGTVEYFKTIGCKRFIIPGAPWDTADGLADTIAKLNEYQPILEAEGVELMYHNHHGELMPNKDGQIAHVEMQKQTAIRFQIDVYWAYRGGVSPLYILEQLKERIAVIHLKDGTMEHGTPLGQGDVPIRAVVEWAEANGVNMVVENEPNAEVEMIEAKMCIDYLKSLEA